MAQFKNLRTNNVISVTNETTIYLMRHNEQYIDSHTNFYLRVGAKSQKSPVELIVLQREELRNRDPFLDKF